MSESTREDVKTTGFFHSSSAAFTREEFRKSLKEGLNVVLIVVNNVSEYSAVLEEVVQSVLLEKKSRKVFVSLSRPYNSLSETVAKNFVVIDAASGLVPGENAPAGKGPLIVKSPANLNELITKISALAAKGITIIIDSVAVLPVYNSERDVMKFLYRLLSNVRKKNALVILFSIPLAGSQKIRNLLATLADKTLEVG